MQIFLQIIKFFVVYAFYSEMKFLLEVLVFVMVFPPCFTAPGTISFETTEIEVEELPYNSVELRVQRIGGTDGVIDFMCKVSTKIGLSHIIQIGLKKNYVTETVYW